MITTRSLAFLLVFKQSMSSKYYIKHIFINEACIIFIGLGYNSRLCQLFLIQPINLFLSLQKYNYQEVMFSNNSQSKAIYAAKSVLNYLYVGLTLSIANPIDFIRFRMQTMQELIKQGRLKTPYHNVIDCFRRVIIEEGKKAFWKGNCSNLLKFYPAQALNWISKEFFQSTYRNIPGNSGANMSVDFLVNYLGGASAGLMTRALLYPLQYTRNKMNNQIKNGEGGIWTCLQEVYKKQGLKGIYRGALVSFVGVAIFRSTYFGIYDTFKESTQTQFQRWLVSYISVFSAISLTYPSDTVRRRMMLTSCAEYKYKNFVDCAKQIWSREGPIGFYSGAPMIFLQSATGATIYFIFDMIIKDMKRKD